MLFPFPGHIFFNWESRMPSYLLQQLHFKTAIEFGTNLGPSMLYCVEARLISLFDGGPRGGPTPGQPRHSSGRAYCTPGELMLGWQTLQFLTLMFRFFLLCSLSLMNAVGDFVRLVKNLVCPNHWPSFENFHLQQLLPCWMCRIQVNSWIITCLTASVLQLCTSQLCAPYTCVFLALIGIHICIYVHVFSFLKYIRINAHLYI